MLPFGPVFGKVPQAPAESMVAAPLETMFPQGVDRGRVLSCPPETMFPQARSTMDRGTLREKPRRNDPSVSACRGSCTRPPPMQGIPLGTSAARKQEGTVLAGTRGRLISRREAAKGRCFPAARRLGRCFPERRLGRCCPGAPTMTDGQRTMLPCGPASGTMLPQTPPETMFPQGCLKTLAGIPDVTGVCVPNNKLSHNKLPSGELFKVFTFPLRSVST